jgi:ketosteroid isomerase-like protein
MRALRIVALSILVALGFLNGLSQAAEEEEVAKLEQARVKAILSGDVDSLEQLYGNTWFYNTAAGKSLTKSEYLGDLRSGKLKVHESSVEDVRIQTYGESATVTGIQHVKATVNGKDVQVDLRFLHVYAKPEGRWVVVARQATYLTPPK